MRERRRYLLSFYKKNTITPDWKRAKNNTLKINKLNQYKIEKKFHASEIPIA